MAKPTQLPDPTCLHLQLLDASETTITAVVTTTSQEAECPLCHGRSARIHSRYVRSVADLPWMACAVRLELQMRRFFCSNPACERQIFTERVPTVVAPYARRTTRLGDAFTLIGFTLGGEAGKRLVAGMGLSTSPDTFLRLIRAQPEEQAPTPVLSTSDIPSGNGHVLPRRESMLATTALTSRNIRWLKGPFPLPDSPFAVARDLMERQREPIPLALSERESPSGKQNGAFWQQRRTLARGMQGQRSSFKGRLTIDDAILAPLGFLMDGRLRCLLITPPFDSHDAAQPRSERQPPWFLLAP